MKTYAPSATKRCAVARPIPLLPPVMTATFPSSLVIVILLFDFILRATSVSYGIDVAAGESLQQLCIDRYGWSIEDRHETKKKLRTEGESPLLRSRQSPGPCVTGVLAERIRGRVSVGPDQSCGREPPEPVCRLRR